MLGPQLTGRKDIRAQLRLDPAGQGVVTGSLNGQSGQNCHILVTRALRTAAERAADDLQVFLLGVRVGGAGSPGCCDRTKAALMLSLTPRCSKSELTLCRQSWRRILGSEAAWHSRPNECAPRLRVHRLAELVGADESVVDGARA